MKTPLLLILLFLLAFSGCSVKKMASKSLADSLSSGQASVFASDEDTKLVGDALPFSLKLMEAVREEANEHVALHIALASGFTQYAYGWVLWPAEKLEDEDYRKSQAMKARAHKLFMRAHGYAARGLELSHHGFLEAYEENQDKALKMLEKKDVQALYWLAGSLAMAVKTALDEPEMINRLTEVGLLLNRALALDADWKEGAIHEALVSYCAAIGESLGGGEALARSHYEKALALKKDTPCPSLHLALAEGVSVANQDKTEFLTLVKKALEADEEADKDNRLQIILAKERASWLLSKTDDLFL